MHKNLFIRTAPAIIIALSITSLSALIGRHALAATTVNVNLNTRTYRPTKAKPRTVWVLPKTEEAYKNPILTAFQDVFLPKYGIHTADQKKWAAAIIFHESGTLTYDRIADHGCSLGIMQYNACAHEGISAKALLKKPGWNSLNAQLDKAAAYIAGHFTTYSTIKGAVISHNCPACVNTKDKTLKAIGNSYYAKVAAVVSTLSSKTIK